MRIDHIRTEYLRAELHESNVAKMPFDQFKKWLNEALEAGVSEPTAMSLVTIGLDGFPDSRIVLLKDFNETGLTFFTNYNSQKGKSMALNCAVSLHFFWPELERQIRISGFAEKTTREISDNYFKSRPVNSQIAAIVSDQSTKVEAREYLQNQFEKLKSETDQTELRRPENWGGYVVKPVKYEFWQGRENRLHDRILYENENENWLISRLAP